jgi:hypothetical protein
MIIIDSMKCVWNEADKMFCIGADDAGIDLLDPPSEIGMSDQGISYPVKLKFSLVTHESEKSAVYHATYIPPGKYYDTIPIKQYYLMVR